MLARMAGEFEKMSFLEEYTWRTLQTRGLMHQRNLAILRNYIGTTPENDLIYAIDRINRIDQLKTLWEAGLKVRLQQAVLRRYEELIRRRGT